MRKKKHRVNQKKTKKIKPKRNRDGEDKYEVLTTFC